MESRPPAFEGLQECRQEVKLCHDTFGVGVMAVVGGHWGVCWRSSFVVCALGA